MIQDLFNSVESSFLKASKGLEDFRIVVWHWGVGAYVFCFVIQNLLFGINGLFLINVVLSTLFAIYFSWHLYAVFKCKPKKEKLTKEQKKILKQKQKQERFKILMEKLLLQRPFTEWNTPAVLIVADLYMISNFLSYLL